MAVGIRSRYMYSLLMGYINWDHWVSVNGDCSSIPFIDRTDISLQHLHLLLGKLVRISILAFVLPLSLVSVGNNIL